MFNKIKPLPFAGKVGATEATRWKDSMKKSFIVLRVSEIDQQRLAVFNLKGSAWEWWKSVSTDAEQDTLTWVEFERRFNRMFIPETTKNTVK